MKKLTGTIFGLCSTMLLGLASSATAASQWCTGTVLSSWIQSDGNVYINSSWLQNHTQICNLKTDWKGVPADVCVGWVAKLDAAATMNKTVTVFYSDAPACSSLPAYESSPGPRYVMVLNS